jgi:16S rRNA (cytidine1402-2'-O)-methyltransferase
MSGTLYLVATPIGNLEDISSRALRVLAEVDLIACEDTRRTQVLLNHFGIKTRTMSYHEHNERERAAQISQLIESGKNVALVSDAGTPLINDPGFRLTRAAIESSLRIVSIPGPTALISALVASGLPADQFFFAGFLPPRANARRAKLGELKSIPATLVFYEAPHRIAATLRDAGEILGDRQATIARELTKLHEEILRGSLSDLAERFADGAPARGEIVLTIGAAETVLAFEGGDQTTLSQRLIGRVSELEREGMDAKTALKQASRELGMKRAEAYRTMVAQKKRPTRP